MSEARSTQALPFTLFEGLESEKNLKTGQVRKRTMRFDINALADFEQEAGMGLGQLLSTKAMFATARALAWAGMRHEDRTISVPAVGLKIQEYTMSGGQIDVLLTTMFEIAKEQGAFGRDTEEPEYGDAKPALTDGNTIEGEAKTVPSSPPPPSPGPVLVEGA